MSKNTPQWIIDELNAGLDGMTRTSVEFPTIGDTVLVKFRGGETLYCAVYSAENEFDVFMKNTETYRNEWYKHSKVSIKSWKRIN